MVNRRGSIFAVSSILSDIFITVHLITSFYDMTALNYFDLAILPELCENYEVIT